MPGGAEYQIAIKIAGNLDKSFTSAVSGAQKSLNALGAFGKVGGESMKIAAAAMSGIGAGLAGFGAASVAAGMKFDSSMSQVAATMGKTVSEITDLRDFAMDMGAKTAFSATQAADALNFMALAGYDAETSMGMLPNVLNLAAAGSMELAAASDMITDSQSALGLTLAQTSTLVDQLAAASSHANANVEQMGSAILTVGGTAKVLSGGMMTLSDGTKQAYSSTTELNQVLGLLADNGVKGAEGGTALRNIILSLTTPTDKAAASLKNLGVKALDSSGNMRSIKDIFADLNKAMSGMSEGKKTEILNEIFNKVDLKSVNALMGTNVKRWDELAASIEKSKYAAEKMAKVQLDNLAGDVTLWKSALEGAQIMMSDILTPSTREFVQSATSGLTAVTDAFKQANESQSLVQGFRDAEGAIRPVGEIAGELGERFKNLSAVVPYFSFRDAAGELGSVSDLADGIYRTLSSMAYDEQVKFSNALGVDKLDDLYEILDPVNNLQWKLQDIIEQADAAVSGDMNVLQSIFPDHEMEEILSWFNGSEEGAAALQAALENIDSAHMTDGFAAMTEVAGNVIAEGVTRISEAVPQFIQASSNIAQGIIQGLISNGPALTLAVSEMLSQGIQAFLVFYGDFWSTGAELFAQFLQGMTGQAPQIIQTAVQTVQRLSQGLTSQFPAILTAATQIGVYILQGLAAIAPGLLGMGGTLLMQLARGILNGLPVLTNTAVAIMGNFGQYLQTNLPALMATGLNMILVLSASIRENAGKLVDGAIGLALNLARGLADSIPVIVSAVPTIVSNIAGVINDNAPKLLAAGVRIIATLAMGIIRAIPVIAANIPKILRAIYDVFTAFNWLSLGKNAMTAIAKGFRSAFSAIPNLLKSIPNLIKGFFTTGASIIKNFGWASLGRGIVQTIALGLSSLPSALLKIGHAAFQWFRSINWPMLGWEILQGIVSGLFNLGGALGDAVKGIGSGIWDGLTGLFTGGGKKAAEAAANGIAEGTPAMTAAAENAGNRAFSGFSGSFAAAVPGMAADAASAGMALADGMSSGVLAGTESLGGAISGLGDTVATTLNSAITGNLPDVNAAALASGNAITDGITTGIDSGMADAASTAANASLETIGALADGISAGADTVTGTVSDMTATVTGALDQCWTDVSAATDTSWADIGANMQSGLTAMSSGVTDTLSVMQSGVSDSMTAFSGTITDTMGTAQAAISSGTQEWNAEVSAAMGTLSGTIDDGMASVTASTENAITAMQGTMQTGMDALTATAGDSFSALQATIQASMDSVNQTFAVSIQAMTVTAQNGIVTMSGAMQSGFSAMQTTAQDSFSAIRASIEGEMNRATAAVQAAVSAMKAAMNFSWKLPDLKVPQVNVSGAFSLEPPTAPQFSVSWHREGGILTGAQIFGMSGNTLLGGGEAGKEAVLPLAVLWPNMAAVMTSVLERSAYPEAADAQNAASGLPPEVMETAVTENLTGMAQSLARNQGDSVTNASYLTDATRKAVSEAFSDYAERTRNSLTSYESFPTEIVQSAMTTAMSNFADSRIGNQDNGISSAYSSFPVETVQNAVTQAMTILTESHSRNTEITTEYATDVFESAIAESLANAAQNTYAPVRQAAEYAPVFSEIAQNAGDAYSQSESVAETENAVSAFSVSSFPETLTNITDTRNQSLTAPVAVTGAMRTPAPPMASRNVTSFMIPAATGAAESQYNAAYSSVANGGGTVDIYANAVSVNATGPAYASYASSLTDAAQSDAMTETLTNITDARNQAVTLPAALAFPNPTALSDLPPSETFNGGTARFLNDNRSWSEADAVTNNANESAVLLVAILPQLLDAIREPGVTDRANAYLEQAEAADAGSASGSVSDLLSLLDRGRDGGKGEPDDGGGEPVPAIHITYQPQYHFHGDAPRKEDMEQAESQSRAEFERWANAWFEKRMRDFSRKSFSQTRR